MVVAEPVVGAAVPVTAPFTEVVDVPVGAVVEVVDVVGEVDVVVEVDVVEVEVEVVEVDVVEVDVVVWSAVASAFSSLTTASPAVTICEESEAAWLPVAGVASGQAVFKPVCSTGR